MKLAVITGVGPGHETIVNKARQSVADALRNGSSFSSTVHDCIDDTKGDLGCPSAKNAGIDRNPDADWFFFLDADDLMEPDALLLNRFDAPATFGSVKLSGVKGYKNVFPCGWREIAINGAGGTLTMGFFCRADIAKAIRFEDGDELTDDFKFYLALPSFVKLQRPICTTCVDVPSSVGPKRIGAATADWTGNCNKLIREAVARNPDKFGVSADLVLSNVAPT